ncbi:hypothetical protein NM688_g7658 [Phlebia brevispora]|uniref:Uncharacterized protein n=1 Tax=Phlebia brevispora TaxID=194682 RepID=A0ACC1S2M9_9APHY|nr:hypothetical protein NM688_g7658 [Phlebia brevispora]
MPLCDGCFKSFRSNADLSRHLANTHNPTCITAYQSHPIRHAEEVLNVPLSLEDDILMGDDTDMLGDNDEPAADPKPIEDYFGTDYTEEELGLGPQDRNNNEDDAPQWVDANGSDGQWSEPSPCDSESDDDELSPDEDEEPGWEAPVAAPDVGLGQPGQHQHDEPTEQDRADDEERAEDEDEEHADGDEVHILRSQAGNTRMRIEEALRHKVYIQHFPSEVAGQPVDVPGGIPAGYAEYQSRVPGHVGDPSNIFAPFQSELDWKVARWAKLRGSGSTAVSELLEIPGVQEKLQLSYKNVRELNRIIDALPAARLRFVRDEIVVAEEVFDVYMRDVIECLKSLFGDAEFARYLVFLPE